MLELTKLNPMVSVMTGASLTPRAAASATMSPKPRDFRPIRSPEDVVVGHSTFSSLRGLQPLTTSGVQANPPQQFSVRKPSNSFMTGKFAE